jgi:hypothetical protein
MELKIRWVAETYLKRMKSKTEYKIVIADCRSIKALKSSKSSFNNEVKF